MIYTYFIYDIYKLYEYKFAQDVLHDVSLRILRMDLNLINSNYSLELRWGLHTMSMMHAENLDRLNEGLV